MSRRFGRHLRRGVEVVGIHRVVLAAVSLLLVVAAASGAGAATDAFATPSDSAVSMTTNGTTATVASTTASNHLTTIRGQVQYQNLTGGLEPARQIQLKIRKDIAGPINPKIAETTTNETGHWSVQIDVADRESNLDGDDILHLRIQAIAQNPAVNVIRFGQNAGTANGRTYTLDRGVTVSRGQNVATFDQTATSTRNRRVFQVANWSLEARRFSQDEIGWTRKRVKVKFPAANDDNNQYKSPFNKIVIGNADWGNGTRHTVHHEYGHAVMGGLFGYKGWQIPKYKGSHCIWSETGRITGWYEGFAEFHEAAVNGTGNTDGMGLEWYRWYNDSRSHGGDCPGSDAGGWDGAEVEGAIANILWDLYDPANEPHDEINGSLATIYDAVDEKDNRAWGRIANKGRTRDVHDFYIQYVDNTGNQEGIRKIFEEYGIIKPDRFEHNPSPGSSGFTCSRGFRLIDEVPCRFFTAQKWSTVPTNESVDAGLHFTDTDYYEVDLLEEQRVTVDVTAHARTGNLTLLATDSKVSGMQGSTLGSRTQNGPHETLTFTAADNGTHYIRVGSRNFSHLAIGSYTLNVSVAPQPDQSGEQNDDHSTASPLTLAAVSDTRNTTVVSAATARHDDDHYEVTLRPGHRIEHAQILNGPDLTLTLENDTHVVARVRNGAVLSTTTAPEGVYSLNVSGVARQGYELNVTTRLISQKYEQNDRQAAAADLTTPLGLNRVPQAGTSNRGSTTWCTRSNNNGNVGGNLGGGTLPGVGMPCPRHNWQQHDQVVAGFSPADPDWYSVPVQRDQKLVVNTTDDRLGVELYHGGQQVAARPASAPGTTLRHVAQSGGTYYINVTGDEYVPLHQMSVQRVIAAGQDRLEPNDRKSTATSVSRPVSGNGTQSYDLLQLAGEDDDVFAVDLDAGERLNATLVHLQTGGNVTLTIVGPNGGVTSATDITRNIGPPEHRDYTKRAKLTAQTSGTYYVTVASSRDTALKYNLTINTWTKFEGLSGLNPPIRADLSHNYYLFDRISPGGDGPCKLCDTELPDLVFGEEQVNVCVLNTNDFESGVSHDDAPANRCFHANISDGTVTSVGPQKLSKASLYVTMSEATFDDIATADDPRAMAQAKYDSGEITVHGIGMASGLKIALLNIAKAVVEALQGLVEMF